MRFKYTASARYPMIHDIPYIGRDRFESTTSAGRRIHSASPIDLPLAIPEDPLPSSAKGGGRR